MLYNAICNEFCFHFSLLEIIHNVSIKLLTTWNEIYTMIDSEAYISMKELVQNSVRIILLFIVYNSSFVGKITKQKVKFKADSNS